MLGRAERMWLRPAIFFGAVCGIAIVCPPRGFAQSEGSDSISALPTPSGPDDSTPAADYVRKPTDPPPFNSKSPQAIAARKRAAAEKPRLAQVPTTDGTAAAVPPGSAKVMTSQLLPAAAAKPAIPIPSTATPPFAPGGAAAPGAAPVTATPFAAPTTATPFSAPVTATPFEAPASGTPPAAPLTAAPTSPAAAAPPSAGPPATTVVPLYATPVPASPPDTAAAPESAAPPAAATPPEEAAAPEGAAPPGVPVAAPGSAAEAPEAPASGQRPNVVGVDSYGQTIAPAQPTGQPPATPVPASEVPPSTTAPTSMPPSDMPQGTPASPSQTPPPPQSQ